MGKYLTADKVFCYFIWDQKGIKIAAPIMLHLISVSLNEALACERIGFRDYIYSTPPWHQQFSDNEKNYKDYFSKEIKLRDSVLVSFKSQSDLSSQFISKYEINPRALINLLECFCWTSGIYEAECLVLSDTEYDYSIYEIKKGFFSSKSRGDKVATFRFDEFISLSIDAVAFAFRIESRYCSFNGRLDSRFKFLLVD